MLEAFSRSSADGTFTEDEYVQFMRWAIIANYRVWAAADKNLPANFAEERSSTLFDTVAIYLAIRPELCVMEKLGIRVTDNGLTVIDPQAKQVTVATSWKDLGGYQDWIVERLTGKK